MNTSKMSLNYLIVLVGQWGSRGITRKLPVIEATFNFEGTDYTSTFSVLDATDAIMQVQEETGVQIHGVLGTQFLMENKWIVDFYKLIVTHDDRER